MEQIKMVEQLTGLNHFCKHRNRFDFLEPSLHRMFDIVDAYLKEFDSEESPDRPYFYNERATLSLLAGGIWQSYRSNLVLEEYCSPKIGEIGTYRGRFDMWFKAAGQSCTCEAKQLWFNLKGFTDEDADPLISVLRGEADAALSCVQEHMEAWRIDRALGIVFVVPGMRWRDRHKALEWISGALDTLDGRLRDFCQTQGYCGLRASYFPDRNVVEAGFGKEKGPDSARWPGLVVLIAEKERER